jgi:transmembrane sensor
MNYFDYSVEDFANDPLFVQWVRKPDARLDLFWHGWLKRHPEKKQVVEQARAIVLFLRFEPLHPTEEEMREVKKGIRDCIRPLAEKGSNYPEEGRQRPGKAKGQLISFWKPLPRRVGMVAAGVLALAFLLLYHFYQPEVFYATSYGETRDLELPDGSRVVLNGNSQIRFLGDWKRTHQREVWLKGEGYFEVLKKPEWEQASFTVHTEGVEVEVLGTSFNVNNRRGRVQVMLNSGKVKLYRPADGGAAISMQPRDFVEVQEQGTKVFIKEVAPERYTSWVRQKLVFDETPLREIAQTLEDTYGLHVVFREERLQDLPFTGAVPNRNVDLFLRVLSESLEVNVARQGQTVIMSQE